MDLVACLDSSYISCTHLFENSVIKWTELYYVKQQNKRDRIWGITYIFQRTIRTWTMISTYIFFFTEWKFWCCQCCSFIWAWKISWSSENKAIGSECNPLLFTPLFLLCAYFFLFWVYHQILAQVVELQSKNNAGLHFIISS